MKHWNDISAQTPQTDNRRGTSASENLSPQTLSPDFILRFVAGIMVMLGLRAEVRSARSARAYYMSTAMIDPDRLPGGFHIRRPVIPDLNAWAAGPTVSVRVQSRKLWLSSKAINNSPDPNIRRMGHDAWATGRAYPTVPGLKPGASSTLTLSFREIPDMCFVNSGNTEAAGGSKIVIAPP